ncbi:MAG: SDR family oxidoreductase [Nitrospira sp.]|nr:SDR family oxidoreductase [Nitrospira sp.]
MSKLSALSFFISQDMVQAFSALTGDQSALHVSEEFARRTAYRSPVVHGMLPAAFLALVEELDIVGKPCRLTRIEMQFATPVYFDDRLELSVEPASTHEAETESAFEFRIQKTGAEPIVTSGSFRVSYEQEPDEAQVSAASAREVPCALVAPCLANNWQLEDLSVGVCDGMDFVIQSEALHAFLGILAKGLCHRDAWPSSSFIRSFAPNLLATLLSSTFVGMRVPGKSATFLSLSAQWTQQIQCGHRYRLEGKVTHVSRATRIVKTALSITGKGEDRAAMLGRASALVNKPSRSMPTAAEMNRSSVDWGLTDKVVLVTGASRGIGETVVKLFALLGSKVIVNFYRGKDDAERVVREIVREGGNAIAIGADVTVPEEVERMVSEARAQYGTIHILVNNAVRDFRPASFTDLTWEDIQRDLDIIVKGAFHCCKAVIPGMLAQGGGKIINISTVAVDDPPPNQLKYVVAKSALQGFTRSLAIELASKNIQVNTVAPSFVETDLVAHIQDGFRKKIAQETPMQRHASPVEVAQAVLFLASKFASYTTGQKIMLTGGRPPFL